MWKPYAALAWMVAVGAVTGWAASAAAHGRPAAPTALHLHPTDPDALLLHTSRGLVVSQDGGANWHWICSEVLGADTFGERDPVMVRGGSGRVLVADGSSGVRIVNPSLCGSETVAPDPSDPDRYISDVARHPVLPDVMFALQSDAPPTVNQLFRSDDGGTTWTPTNPGIDAEFLESVAIAPSNAAVIYVAGVRVGAVGSPSTGLVYRSADGGQTWSEPTTVALQEGELRPRIEGIDPSDPDRVFVRAEQVESLESPPPDRLLLSEDGGQSFEEVASYASMNGFAIDSAGSTVWVGDDSEGGLWRSEDGGLTFDPVQPGLAVHCLKATSEGLWVCGDGSPESFALGWSEDGGETIAPVLDFSQIAGTVDCPPESEGAQVCSAFQCDALAELGADLSEAAPSCAAETADGGATPGDGSTGPVPAGGGCGVVATTPERTPAWASVLPLLLAWRLRRRLRNGG